MGGQRSQRSAKIRVYPFAEAIQVLRRAAKDGILQVTVPLGGLSRDNVGGWNALDEMANWNAILFLKRAQREEEEGRETNSKRALIRVVAGNNLNDWRKLMLLALLERQHRALAEFSNSCVVPGRASKPDLSAVYAASVAHRLRAGMEGAPGRGPSQLA